MKAPLFPLGAFGVDASLLVAVVLGLGFGFFLERGGLGNPRKLVAQFYLTDLTVFKVMFTAIITAMLGLFWLGEAGLIELSLVSLSATYAVPQMAGGLLFGAGFVIGGYCPGTACVAAASGRLDGLATLAGMMVGILIFGEAYPALQGFANLTPLGRVTLADLVAVRPGVLVGGITLLALAALALANRIERTSGSRLVGPE